MNPKKTLTPAQSVAAGLSQQLGTQVETPSSPMPLPAPALPKPQLEQRLSASQQEALAIREFEQTLSLRFRWSGFLMGMVLVMVVFQMGLFVMVGLNWLQFSDEWIARLVLPGTFAQVLGFVYIIINYLFPNQKA